jgi:hypothetical protein
MSDQLSARIERQPGPVNEGCVVPQSLPAGVSLWPHCADAYEDAAELTSTGALAVSQIIDDNG